MQPLAGYRFEQLDVAQPDAMLQLFAAGGFEAVVHLAAQAGVRHSLQAPFVYTHSNVTGMLSILEACRTAPYSVR